MIVFKWTKTIFKKILPKAVPAPHIKASSLTLDIMAQIDITLFVVSSSGHKILQKEKLKQQFKVQFFKINHKTYKLYTALEWQVRSFLHMNSWASHGGLQGWVG